MTRCCRGGADQVPGHIDRDVGVDPIAAGALGLAIHIEHRGAIDEQDIAALDGQVFLTVLAQQRQRQIDFTLEGFAIAGTRENHDIGTGCGWAAGKGNQVGNFQVGGFQRIATGPG